MTRLTRLIHGGGGGSPGTALLKKVLLSLIVVGLLTTVTLKRTMAALSGEVDNTNNSQAVGTLTFSDLIQGQATSCTSNGGTAPVNNRTDQTNFNICAGSNGILFSGQTVPFLRYPALSASAGDWVGVIVKNTGSIDANSLQVALPSCTGGVTPNLPAYVVAPEATGNPCSTDGLELYIQEVSNGNFNAATTNVNLGCLYDDTLDDSNPIGTGSVTDCTTNWQVDSLSDLHGASCWDLGRLAAQSSRYFKIGIRFPPDADQSFQGTTATFQLRWHIYDNQHTSTCGND